MVVELGDVIVFQLVQPDPVSVVWQQNWRSHSKEFYYIPFDVQGKDDGSSSYLAVERNYWNKFEKFTEECPAPQVGTASKFKKENTTQYGKLKVTREFRYGQNNERTFRFVVLGDKSDNIYQHRFSTAFANLKGNKSTSEAHTVLEYLGAMVSAKVGSDALTNMAKAVVGDPLREF